jgi:hypothetical protein
LFIKNEFNSLLIHSEVHSGVLNLMLGFVGGRNNGLEDLVGDRLGNNSLDMGDGYGLGLDPLNVLNGNVFDGNNLIRSLLNP